MSHTAARHSGNADSLKESAVAVKDAVADLAGETRRYASHRMDDARNSASAMARTIRSKAEEYNGSMMNLIRRNPYKSVAIAAGVGLAAGYLLRRRH